MEIIAVSVSVTLVLAAIGFAFWLGNWHGRVNSDRADFRDFMQYVRGRIDDIFDRLPNPLTGSTSPLGLTDLGQKISGEIEARQWASKNLANAK